LSHRPVPPAPGPGAVAARRAEMLRVDHAGELAAVFIYRGQRAVFGHGQATARIRGQLEQMQAHEAEHLATFNERLTAERVRPTLFAPVWRAAAFTLGAATALMGEKAAHACTEAVESVIEGHYADQMDEIEARDPELAAELSRFRDEELAHHDLAVAEGAREAPGYTLLTAVIKAGCRAAIRISEKL
jgi:ubiquinone biosynthesis monooxygenase Coq7